MARPLIRGGVEDTRLDAKAKDTKKIRGQGQGQGQPLRVQTISRPRTGMLEAKAKDQGHKAQVLSKKKKKVFTKKFFRRSQKKKKVFTKIFQAISKKKKGLHKNFSGDLKKKKKRSSQKFFRRSPKKKKGLHKNFSGDLQKKKRSSQTFFKQSPL